MPRAQATEKSAKSKGAKSKKKPPVEEIHFKSDSAFLCLVLNRRTGFIRVIDFRSGALPAKRLFIQSIARREKIAKVITLVEKDEVSSWTKVGFVREGTIPGFYKRSDGHLVGCVINEKTASIEVSDDSVKIAEKTVNAGKKNSKEIPAELMQSVVVKEIDERTARRARDDAWRRNDGLGAFDAFGREAERFYLESTAKRGRTNHLSAEYQDCFGHALVEVLRPPRDDLDVLAITRGLETLDEMLLERGIVSTFCFAPNDDIGLATAFIAAGYRKTGLLASGSLCRGERKDAILWTRKLANPADDN
jgi:hypothetical protein